MQSNWETDDEEAFEGPDAYIEGDEIDYDDIYPTGELIVEGHESSAQGTLRCACASYYNQLTGLMIS